MVDTTNAFDLNRAFLIRIALDHYQGLSYVSTKAEDEFLTGLLNDALSVPDSGFGQTEIACFSLHLLWSAQCEQAQDLRSAALRCTNAEDAPDTWDRAMRRETIAHRLAKALHAERDEFERQASEVLANAIANY